MRKIDRYEVESELGRGNMGVVYLATDPRLRRKVAVKTFHRPDGLSEAAAEEYRERFLREAWAAGGLSHPNIVTIHDAGEDAAAGTPFIAMEYVAGRSLREILQESGTLDPERVLAIGRALADGLDSAHAAGIVHRDIKPANILVNDADGGAKIADFGVARPDSSELTRSGSMPGSPAYMSPEQIRGRTVDGRSDLFSLAVILYEALTGERPFAGDDLPALAYSISHEYPVPPSRRRGGLPAGVDSFFEQALAKDPGDRFPDGAAFRQAMEREWRREPSFDPEATAVEVPPVERAPAGRPGRYRSFARLGGLLLAVLLLAWGLQAILVEDAVLRLEARSSVESGTLVLLVDGEEVFERELRASGKKLKRVVKKWVQGGEESFGTEIDLDPGKHELTAEVEIDEGASFHRESVTVDLEPGETRTLKLTAGGPFGKPISLKID